jgi:hypothetical protein
VTRRLAVGLIVAFGVLCTSLGLVFLALSWTAPAPDSWGFRGFTVLFAIGFGGAGAQVTFRRPRNRVGWVLLTAGTLSAVQILVEEYAIFGIVGRSTPLPGAIYAGWIESWIWLVGVTLITTFALLIFPNGAFVSPRWRIVASFSALDGAIGVTALAFTAGPLNNAAFVDNPFPLLGGDVGRELFFASFFGLAILATASAASLIVRFRRAAGVERQQLKWLAYEAGLIAIAVLVTSVAQAVAPNWKPPQVLFILAIALMPFTIAVAVLRYRLYDIDVLINRTIVYGLTTAAIGAAFFTGIVVLQAALRPLTGGSELAVAASTLLCFGLFQPIRRRVQATVDRRFYRSRYDAGRALDTFTSRLAGEVDLDAVGAELANAVRATVQPSHVSVWVRKLPQ